MPLSSSSPRSRNENAWRPASSAFDDGAAEDLAGAGAIAEAAGGDDGGAEVVAFVAQRVAGVDADADRDALASDGTARRLLHRDRAADGVGGGSEGDHQAVAERLHLGAAVGADGVAEELVVGLEDALGVVVAGALHQLGRADEVGEEDGRRGGALGGHSGRMLSGIRGWSSGSAAPRSRGHGALIAPWSSVVSRGASGGAYARGGKPRTATNVAQSTLHAVTRRRF